MAQNDTETQGKPVRRQKYGARATEQDGLRFDSAGEAKRWRELCLREAAGEISGLRRQVRFDLRVKEQLIAFYKADFVYIEAGQEVVEDFKSPASKTASYQLKKKLMRAIHGIEIKETGR